MLYHTQTGVIYCGLYQLDAPFDWPALDIHEQRLYKYEIRRQSSVTDHLALPAKSLWEEFYKMVLLGL